MSTELLEKAAYKKAMKSDCIKWRKLLKNNSISITDAHAAFDAKYPGALSYEGFYKNLNKSSFSFANYTKAKGLFGELENMINGSKKVEA